MSQKSDNLTARVKPHWSFWPIALLGLVWNAMGCLNYVWQSTLSTEVLASLSDAQQAIIEDRPAWATAGFAIAVFVGLLGNVLLLIRRGPIRLCFVLSMLGIVVAMAQGIQKWLSGATFTPVELTMYLIATPLVGLFLIWYASSSRRKYWIG